MKNLVEINSDNIADFLEIFADSSVKILDELDLFDNDEFFAAIPYGKIINYITKKVIEIKDPDEALKKVIAISHAINLLGAIKKSKIIFKIDEEGFNNKIQNVKKGILDYKVNANQFEISNFYNNKDIIEYSSKIDYIFSEYFNEIQLNRVKKYRKDYLKYDFLKLLDIQQKVYLNLINLLNSPSFKELEKVQYKIAHEGELKNLFNDIVLNDNVGMTLADIYIEPGFRLHEYCVQNHKEDTHHHHSNGFVNLSDASIHDFLYKTLNNINTGINITSQHKNLFFILGYPGQGKSSLCKKILFDIYEEKKLVTNNTFYIKIRNITDTNSLINNPIQTLFDHWSLEHNAKFLEINKNNFFNSLLILDGLDELFIKEKLQEKAIDEFCRVFIRETEDKPNLKVIITSRYGYVNLNLLKKTHSIILQLKEFTEDQQLNWLDKYLQFHPETNLNEAKLSLYNNNAAYKPIKELITQPILLHLIATLNQDLTTNTNRATIYNNLFTELIQRSWAFEGQIDNLRGVTSDDLREFLRDIAFAIFDSGREYIHKSVLEKLPETKDFIDRLDYKDKIQDILKTIMIAFYFQEVKKENSDDLEVEKNEYAIEFLHKSLQEYLVAEKIWECLLKLIDKDSRKGKYIIDNPKNALEIINKFLKKSVSDEILTCLIEIIDGSDSCLKEELSERFDLFLPEWLQKGLQIDFNWERDNYYSNDSIIIYNLFSVITNLVDGKNYIREEYHNFFSNRRISWNLKDQVFEGSLSDIISNGKIPFQPNSIYNCVFEFDELYLKKPILFKFNSISLHTVRFIQLNSKASGSFHNTIIASSDFIIPIFEKPRPRKEFVTNYKFNKCRISFCRFFEGSFHFYNSIILETTFYNTSHLSIKNCVFKNCVFFYYERIDKKIFKGANLINCTFIKSNSNSDNDPDLILNINKKLDRYLYI